MRSFGPTFMAILRKELYLYFFGTGFFMVSVIFSLGLFLLFRFTYPIDAMTRDIAISSLWAVHLVSSLFALLAAQEWEWENNALRAVKLSGVEGYIVFLGKSTAALISLGALWLIEMIAWTFLFGYQNLQQAFPEAGVTFFTPQVMTILLQIFSAGILVSLGISFLGQITSVLALHSRFRHILLFIVFFPLALPAIIAASSYSRIAWEGGGWSTGTSALFLNGAFAFIFLAAGVLLYEFLWEE